MVKMQVLSAKWEPDYGHYVALLQEVDGERVFVGFIDEWQAQMVDLLIGLKLTAPHKSAKLISFLLEELKVKIIRIEVFKNFFGKILAKVVWVEGDKTRSMIYAPGEAIELAIRCGADILVQESLLLEPHSPKQDSMCHESEVRLLKEKMAKAIAIEDYEEAARLRDMILKLEKEAGHR